MDPIVRLFKFYMKYSIPNETRLSSCYKQKRLWSLLIKTKMIVINEFSLFSSHDCFNTFYIQCISVVWIIDKTLFQNSLKESTRKCIVNIDLNEHEKYSTRLFHIIHFKVRLNVFELVLIHISVDFEQSDTTSPGNGKLIFRYNRYEKKTF